MEPAEEGPAWQDVDHLHDLIISDCELTSESVWLKYAVVNTFAPTHVNSWVTSRCYMYFKFLLRSHGWLEA